MPNFALHELAHSYHDRVLAGGFGNEAIKAAYEKAKAGGRYDSVERQDSEGHKRMDRAYAMTNPQEYFAPRPWRYSAALAVPHWFSLWTTRQWERGPSPSR